MYAHDGLWYMPALLLPNEKILLFRVDRIHAMTVSDKSHKTTMNLQQWLESDYEPQQPIRLYVELSSEGVRQCLSEPHLEKAVVRQSDGTGYIDTMIDQNELQFNSSLFFRLGQHAIVKEPQALIQLLRQHAQELFAIYPEQTET